MAEQKVWTEMANNGLHDDLNRELAAVRAKRAFNVKEWTERKIAMFNDYMSKHGLKACSISVSGGVDSAVTFGLMSLAAKQPGSPIQRVLGVAQPIHSTEKVWKRALELQEAFGNPVKVVDQTALHDQLKELVDDAIGIKGEPFASGQLRSYQRTPVGYYAAQLISQTGLPCVVMGTGNFDEDGYLMYYCKAGDGVVDIQLIADLHKSEVFEVGRHIGVPASILEAAPTADLWEGQTDHEELGMSYDFVELYIQYKMMSETEQAEFKKCLSPEALAMFNELGGKADSIHRRNCHKAEAPLNINIMPVL
jgi:NAD+ synthase (glutamine-hydrolysing)